jgi:hypothetical protein
MSYVGRGLDVEAVTGARLETVATQGQTVFQVGYTPGFLDVFVNGVRLASTDFVATDGTTVTLNEPRDVGDVVQFIGWERGATVLPTSGFYTKDEIDALLAAMPVGPTLGPAKTLTGTAVDFTDIPAWANRITIAFHGASTNGPDYWYAQIGTGGVPATSGYQNAHSRLGATTIATEFGVIGFLLHTGPGTNVEGGLFELTRVSGNTWALSGQLGTLNVAAGYQCAGSVALSGPLDIIRLTTHNGTNVWDAGIASIMYE